MRQAAGAPQTQTDAWSISITQTDENGRMHPIYVGPLEMALG
jgi:hypothetical protein